MPHHFPQLDAPARLPWGAFPAFLLALPHIGASPVAPFCLQRIRAMKTVCLLASALALALTVGCARHHAIRPRPAFAKAGNPYTAPLVSPGVEFRALPLTVQRTIRAEAGATPISNILKYDAGGRIVYGTYFENPDAFPPLFVATDGSILNPDLSVAVGGVGISDTAGMITGSGVSGLTLSDLPPKGVLVLKKYAPDAEVDTIGKDTYAGQVSYTVTFKGDAYPPLDLDADGNPLNQFKAPLRK